MAKRGYVCKCGWKLIRGEKTRKLYAAAKMFHATPKSQGGEGCELLRAELKRTKPEAFSRLV